MGRIKGQKPSMKELTLQVLMWTTFAKKQITSAGLQHALAVEVGELELDEENIPLIDTILSVCAGLVTLDEESKIVRLVHYTTQEYLQKTQERWCPGSDAEFNIATTCIAYLSLNEFQPGFCEIPTERAQSYPLYGYAAGNWGYHVQGASRSCPGVLAFLQCTEKLWTSVQLLHGLRSPRFNVDGPKNETGLELASWFGIHEALDARWVENLVESQDFVGETPLSWAEPMVHFRRMSLIYE
ncbi:hypothetical protein BKA56DRAFT_674463 [Ilyonectria sp. MPI-CAGE-AT-0026]|nr:hypothetical protein BKA56DRAFT_674463 [Ilyonectria sp. MPI-CAGE-AT-0026]